MTLGELLEGKTLPVKVRRKSFIGVEWFNIIAVSDVDAIGFFDDCTGSKYNLAQCNFELYTEPKKPEILYEFIFWRKEHNDADVRVMTEGRASVHKRLCEYDGYKKTGRSWPKDELDK